MSARLLATASRSPDTTEDNQMSIIIHPARDQGGLLGRARKVGAVCDGEEKVFGLMWTFRESVVWRFLREVIKHRDAGSSFTRDLRRFEMSERSDSQLLLHNCFYFSRGWRWKNIEFIYRATLRRSVFRRNYRLLVLFRSWTRGAEFAWESNRVWDGVVWELQRDGWRWSWRLRSGVETPGAELAWQLKRDGAGFAQGLKHGGRSLRERWKQTHNPSQNTRNFPNVNAKRNKSNKGVGAVLMVLTDDGRWLRSHCSEPEEERYDHRRGPDKDLKRQTGRSDLELYGTACQRSHIEIWALIKVDRTCITNGNLSVDNGVSVCRATDAFV